MLTAAALAVSWRRRLPTRWGADIFVGLPEREEPRVAEMIQGPKVADWPATVLASPFPHSCANPPIRALAPNDRAWREAEVPGANGHPTALGLARVYGMMAAGGTLDGAHIIGRGMISEVARERVRGIDASYDELAAYSAGYQIGDALYAGRASTETFGHSGWCSAMDFADVRAGIGFGYVTNRMAGFDGLDPRRKALVDAVYDSLR